MTNPQESGDGTDLALPKQFTKIIDILNLVTPEKSMVSVIGIIRDFRPPMRSRGSGKSSPQNVAMQPQPPRLICARKTSR